MAVPIRVFRFTHPFIFHFIIQQTADLFYNIICRGPYQLQRSGFHAFRPFCRFSDYKHRLAQTRTLLLYTAAVCKNKI